MSGYRGRDCELPAGTAIHRFVQVSNLTNSTPTLANIALTTILPLLGNGLFNDGYNNPSGYGSVDLVKNLIDVRNVNRNAHLVARVTMTNNGVGGNVNNATLVLRLIPDINNLSVFTEITNVPESFGTQAAFMTMAFHGGIDAIQVGIRTSTVELVRLNGIYLAITDVA